MKKSLLATVAAVALIAGAGMASAQNASQPKDQPKAGARAEPEMKRGSDVKAGAENKGKAETTGAGTETRSEMKSEPNTEMKSDNKGGADKAKSQTTGQASDQKAAPNAKAAADDKSGAANKATGKTEMKSENKADTKAAPASKSAADPQAAPAAKSNAAAADSKGNAGASVSLTTEQKSKIRTSVLQGSNAPKVSRSSINFNISVGTVVPRSGVRFVTVPDTIVEIHPAWRGYNYFVVDEEIIIIDPHTLQIVAVLNV